MHCIIKRTLEFINSNSRWVHAMESSNQKEFVAAADAYFEVDGLEASLFKIHGPLSILKVKSCVAKAIILRTLADERWFGYGCNKCGSMAGRKIVGPNSEMLGNVRTIIRQT
ncbi:uncharacterized protein [Rutidosis leptorrhynchoides]|uniref:uncharacterized protein n=1 Tax=Rutidosis leptorrhynchoides TaxID=125765 RepID=UPI003A9931FB